MDKVIHWELCKKLKFDRTNKWYIHKPASILENDKHNLHWNFDIQTNHLISARRPDLIIINNINNNNKKEKLQNCGLYCPGWPHSKIEIMISRIEHPPYSPDLAPCDFCLFPKFRGCHYETIEEMKEAVTKVIDMLTQEDFHGALQKCWNGTTSSLQPEEITSKETRVSWVYYL